MIKLVLLRRAKCLAKFSELKGDTEQLILDLDTEENYAMFCPSSRG